MVLRAGSGGPRRTEWVTWYNRHDYGIGLEKVVQLVEMLRRFCIPWSRYRHNKAMEFCQFGAD